MIIPNECLNVPIKYKIKKLSKYLIKINRTDD